VHLQENKTIKSGKSEMFPHRPLNFSVGTSVVPWNLRRTVTPDSWSRSTNRCGDLNNSNIKTGYKTTSW